MAKITRGRNLKDWRSSQSTADLGKLRIVGGRFRGRQIEYSGDPVTRPMKDVTREACFNLAGGYVAGKAAFDLFAGTGAMGLEAISRGASRVFLIERHIPTVRVIQSNVQTLDENMQADISSSDTFFWVRQFLKQPDTWPSEPWAVFCCPPYDLFVDRKDDILTMLNRLLDVAPPESMFVIESDERFKTHDLPAGISWQTRHYSPAYISIGHKIDPPAQ